MRYMYKKEIQVVNEDGLHARPASDFVNLAKKYQSKIEIMRAGDSKAYNAKSIVMLMTLGLDRGERAVLQAEGADETEAVDALAAFVADLRD